MCYLGHLGPEEEGEERGDDGDSSPPNALIDSWQVAVRNVPLTGSISHVLVQLPHVFQRMEAENLASVIDARYLSFPVVCQFTTGFHAGFIDYHLPNERRESNPAMPLSEQETETQREMVP